MDYSKECLSLSYLGFEKPYDSNYDVKTVETNGCKIDVKESLMSRISAFKRRREKSLGIAIYPDDIVFYSSNSTGMGGVIGRVAIMNDVLNMNDVLKIRNDLELDLERKFDELSIDFGVGSSVKIEEISLLKKLSTLCIEDLEGYLGDLKSVYDEVTTRSSSLSEGSKRYDEFLKRVEDILGVKRLLKVLSKTINFRLDLVKKRLRNLREIFTKQHSFHFKNLDDYHSTSFNLSFLVKA